ncbi:hypothetical protein V3C99_005670 [Haemonchus contortus]|uniref:Secreted protein n=1 Tax=Haemonchus contortus TaxID=6289 RepID=A0A7I4XUR6_HAECO
MWLPLSTLFLFFSIARIAESKPDASTEIAFADTRGNDVDDEDDVQDPASRKLDVVPENPLPGMMSLGDGSLQEPLTEMSNQQFDNEPSVRRVKRKSGGKKALRNRKTKVNKGSKPSS